MDTFSTPDWSYDRWVISISLLVTLLLWLYFGKIPNHFYRNVDAKWRTLISLRLITKAELDNLCRQVDALEEQIRMLHTAPIKREADGQLGFTELFQDTPKTKTVRKGPVQWQDGKWYFQVWKIADLDQFNAGKVFVERMRNKKKHYEWVEKAARSDVLVDPFVWEEIKTA